jgi:sugar-specific transcriptional regulator TrmB
MKTIDAEENKKRIEAEKEKRLKSEIAELYTPTNATPEGAQEVIDEIEEFLTELKRKAQTAYPITGSGE